MAYMRQRGVGSYSPVGNWSWLYYPPPYDFLAPADSVPIAAPVLFTPAVSGLGGCPCGCAGGCGARAGLGLFESGFDWSQWGIGEWTAAAVGGYLALSVVGDLFKVGRVTARGYRRGRGAVRKAGRLLTSTGRKQARRESLTRQLEALS
jgi:hypothetical protein